MTLQISSVKHCMPKCQSQLAPKLMRTAAIGLCFLSCNARCGDEERDLVDCLNDDALTAESGIGKRFRRVFPSRKTKASKTPRLQEILSFEDVERLLYETPIQKLTTLQFHNLKNFVRAVGDNPSGHEKLSDILHRGVQKGNLRVWTGIAKEISGGFWLSLSGYEWIEAQLDLMLKSKREDIDDDLLRMEELLVRAMGPSKTIAIERLEALVSNCKQRIELLYAEHKKETTCNLLRFLEARLSLLLSSPTEEELNAKFEGLIE